MPVDDRFRLTAYQPQAAAAVVGWAADSLFSRAWLPEGEPPADVVMRQWHADPDVHPFLLTVHGNLVGYGELWVDEAEGEVELAHLLVDPQQRGRGYGKALGELLTGEAHSFGLDTVLRVDRRNDVAIRCYTSLGFARFSEVEEAEWNAGQRREYAWMRHTR
jgi:[ribosomal protein S18]-alanine N-acetyltransferase